MYALTCICCIRYISPFFWEKVRFFLLMISSLVGWIERIGTHRCQYPYISDDCLLNATASEALSLANGVQTCYTYLGGTDEKSHNA